MPPHVKEHSHRNTVTWTYLISPRECRLVITTFPSDVPRVLLIRLCYELEPYIYTHIYIHIGSPWNMTSDMFSNVKRCSWNYWSTLFCYINKAPRRLGRDMSRGKDNTITNVDGTSLTQNSRLRSTNVSGLRQAHRVPGSTEIPGVTSIVVYVKGWRNTDVEETVISLRKSSHDLS